VNTALIFEMLSHPIAPVGDGDLFVLGANAAKPEASLRDTVRRVALRETAWHALDVSRDQSRAPWLLTRNDLYLLSGRDQRQLSFAMKDFGALTSASSWVPALLEALPAADSLYGRRLFALNSMRGAYVFELDGKRLNVLTDEPLDFVACACVAQQGGLALLGATRRPARTDGTPAPGRPAMVQIEVGALGRSQVRLPVPLISVASEVARRLAAPPHRIEPRLAADAVPEAIIASTGSVHLVALTALPNRLDPLDELSPRMDNAEMIGLALVSAPGEVLDVAIYTSCLGTWGDQALLAPNRGHGGPVGALRMLALVPAGTLLGDARALQVDSAAVAGIPNFSELVCRRFQPRHHALVGNFGVARVGGKNEADHAALLIDRGDQRWAVLSDERGLPAPQAPVS
jgi:hypothetical protein